MAKSRKLKDLVESISGAEVLGDLALDMRWSRGHASDQLWGRINPELWEITHNPWAIFQAASPTKLKELLRDKSFVEEMDRVREIHGEKTSEAETWFQSAHPASKLQSVAYFSLEFGLSEALPIYSGGWVMLPETN